MGFKTMTKLGKLYFDREEFNRLARILKQLRQSCQTEEGEDDLKKGTQLLEVYALEIQMYTAQKNNKKLKALYDQSPHQVCHSSSFNPWRDQRVRRKDAPA